MEIILHSSWKPFPILPILYSLRIKRGIQKKFLKVEIPGYLLSGMQAEFGNHSYFSKILDM